MNKTTDATVDDILTVAVAFFVLGLLALCVAIGVLFGAAFAWLSFAILCIAFAYYAMWLARRKARESEKAKSESVG